RGVPRRPPVDVGAAANPYTPQREDRVQRMVCRATMRCGGRGWRRRREPPPPIPGLGGSRRGGAPGCSALVDPVDCALVHLKRPRRDAGRWGSSEAGAPARFFSLPTATALDTRRSGLYFTYRLFNLTVTYKCR